MSKNSLNPKNIFTVENLSCFIQTVEKHVQTRILYVYRGLSKKYEYELLSTIGRELKSIQESLKVHSPKVGRSILQNVEERMFQEFKTFGHIELEKQFTTKYLNDWEILSIARHHGLITRFMDWTMNPLVALYFAAEDHHDSDGFVYYFDHSGEPEIIPSKAVETISPLKIDKNYLFIPTQYSERIKAQDGILLIQSDPTKEFHIDRLKKIIIPKEHKFDILKSLDTIGINRKNLFPDLDGLSSHITNKFKDEMNAISQPR